MIMNLCRRVASLIVICLCVGGCSLLSGGDDDLPLDDREFWSTAIAQNGEPVSLVEGTRIRIGFGGERIRASAGCNSISGRFDIEDDRLVTEELAQTAMGCDPDRHAQDDLLVRLLGAEPVIAVTGDQMVLTSDEVTVTLIDVRVANPDRPLVGTTWEVDGFSRGQTAMSLSTPRRASFVFGADNTVRGTDGCQPLQARVSIDADVLRFVDVVRLEEGGCENQDYVDEFFDSIGAPLTWSVEGNTLTLTDADGVGLSAKSLDE